MQLSLSRWIDMALEQRWLHQPDTDSTRDTVATAIGVWPIADLRAGGGLQHPPPRPAAKASTTAKSFTTTVSHP
jgi:hypothetical protein